VLNFINRIACIFSLNLKLITTARGQNKQKLNGKSISTQTIKKIPNLSRQQSKQQQQMQQQAQTRCVCFIASQAVPMMFKMTMR